MKTSVIDVHDMLSVLSVDGVEKRIGEVPGVESVTVNFAAGSATVRYDETRLEIADIRSAVRQSGNQPAAPTAASAGEGHEGHTAQAAPPATSAPSAPKSAAAAPTTAAPAGDQEQDQPAPDKKDRTTLNLHRRGIMTIANVSQGRVSGLPHTLRTAQEAIHLPEVQEMLRRLSEYKLGIFMPHMHDERTGEFQPLPDDVTQVESALEVSFQPTADITHQTDRFLPVGWLWRAGASRPVAACEMIWEGQGDSERPAKHKM